MKITIETKIYVHIRKRMAWGRKISNVSRKNVKPNNEVSPTKRKSKSTGSMGKVVSALRWYHIGCLVYKIHNEMYNEMLHIHNYTRIPTFQLP
jgi:hypothetical protein